MAKNNKINLITGQFNDSFLPIMDGVGLVTRNYAYWLNKKYGKSYVITPGAPNYKDNEKMPVLRFASMPIPKRKPYRYGLPWLDFKFQKKLKKIKFDIVHAHCPFVSGVLALKIARRLKIPLVASFHTKYHEDFKTVIPSKLILDKIVKRIANFYEQADSVWVPNKSTIATLREYGYKGNVEVMPNGTDIVPPKNLTPLKSTANIEFETSNDEFVLLSIGQIRWEKNLKLMIDAIKKVAEQKKKFRMIFVGEGYAENGIKQLIKNKGLNSYVKFLGVVRDRKRIESYYARANLFLFPSLYDTSPLTLREAAAFKLPTLLIENSTASEEVIDEKNGFLSANTPQTYAKKIIELMEDRKKLSKAGKGAYVSFYRTWEQTLDEVAKKYEAIIKSHI